MDRPLLPFEAFAADLSGNHPAPYLLPFPGAHCAPMDHVYMVRDVVSAGATHTEEGDLGSDPDLDAPPGLTPAPQRKSSRRRKATKRLESSPSNSPRVGYEHDSPKPAGKKARTSLDNRLALSKAAATQTVHLSSESSGPSVPEDATCSVCNEEGDPKELIICDGCNALTHLQCLQPPLKKVPQGAWHCNKCLPKQYRGEADVLDDMAVMNYLVNGECEEFLTPGDSLKRVMRRSSRLEYDESLGSVFQKATHNTPRRKIPPATARAGLIAGCHDRSGHFGVRRTESLLTKTFHWHGMREDIKEATANCNTCRRFTAQFNTDPELHPIPVVPSAWHSIGVAIVGPFPTSSEGHRYAVVAIDYFTKWVEAQALVTQSSAETAAFMAAIINRHGAPSIVRTDQGSHFQGQFADVLTANLVDHHLSRAYHPQSNGLVERSVQTISRALKRTVGGQGDLVAQTWATRLPDIVRGYNMSTQSSTRRSPFFLMHGFHPKVPQNTIRPSPVTEGDNDSQEDQPAALGLKRRLQQIHNMEGEKKKVAKNIEAAQKRQAQEFNKRRGIPEGATLPDPASLFKKGDYVLTRELNPNHALKPGEQAGAAKLRGTIRGPFRYVSVSPVSKKYAAIEDSNGNQWDKAFHDLVLFDGSRLKRDYKVSEFPIATREGMEMEQAWRSPPPTPQKSTKASKRTTQDEEDYEEEEDLE